MSFLKNISNEAAGDQELAALYRQSGDIKVLAVLYQRYMELVYGVCLKYLKEPENARDAVMAIFEELVGKLRKHEVIQFKGWLYTVAKTHCLMQLRSGKHKMSRSIDENLVQSPDETHLEEAWEREILLEQLSACLETLSEDQKFSVEQFYLQGKCYKEISAMTGLDWNKIRSLIQNGRRNLKICMEKQIASKDKNE